jgi:hypothetical protein
MLNWRATLESEYANSPTIVQLIANMAQYFDPDSLTDQFYDLIMNIDTAVGYGLDVWGRILCINRVLEVTGTTYFGFSGPGGPSGAPWNQGVFYNGEPLTSNFALLDNPFRTLLLAKALFNITPATIPAINQILINLFGPDSAFPVAGNSYVVDNLDMSLTYTFGSALNPVQKAIVYQSGILPRPCGIIANVVEL